MKHLAWGWLLISACAWGEVPSLEDVVFLGGQTSIMIPSPDPRAFSQPAANLPGRLSQKFQQGERLFGTPFTDPASQSLGAVGPAFNHIACMGCHVRGGRGGLPAIAPGTWAKFTTPSPIFLRMSIEAPRPERASAANDWGAPVPVPGFGRQLFHLGAAGLREDQPRAGLANLWMSQEIRRVVFPDGSAVELMRPSFRVDRPYDQTVADFLKPRTNLSRLLQSDVRFSPRMTNPIIGLGLLEAIPEEQILALAKRDLRKWGIRGRPNYALDIVKKARGVKAAVSLGRFGLKANTPSVRQQTAGALQGDLGVTNPLFPNDNIEGTPLLDAYRLRFPGHVPKIELGLDAMESLVLYAQTLAVPTRRDVEDPIVRRGARAFEQVGCALCHNPSFRTGPHEISALSNQLIWPFTDLLLHDMGEGLADGRRDFQASGRDWKTPALWGLGHTRALHPRAGFLHDGRARTLEEAIVWHGGEGERSKQLWMSLPQSDRAAVIRFLESL